MGTAFGPPPPPQRQNTQRGESSAGGWLRVQSQAMHFNLGYKDTHTEQPSQRDSCRPLQSSPHHYALLTPAHSKGARFVSTATCLMIAQTKKPCECAIVGAGLVSEVHRGTAWYHPCGFHGKQTQAYCCLPGEQMMVLHASQDKRLR